VIPPRFPKRETPKDELDMMRTLQVLERHGVNNVHAILGIGHALFRAIDVARSLGLRNPQVSVSYYFSNLPKHKGCRYLTSRQVYELLLRSHKITAREFRLGTCVDWCVREHVQTGR
jgi:prophage antirepressor-like protein